MLHRTILKYPKLTSLFLTFILAYALFQNFDKIPFGQAMASLGLLGLFLGGMFYSYGFTAAPASAFFLTISHPDGLLPSAIIAGFGALASDLILFNLIRHSFMDEVIKLSREPLVNGLFQKIPVPIKKHVFFIIAAFFIASPLPDEIGVFMLASYKDISTNTFMIISFFLNTLGIYTLLWVGSLF